MLKKVVIALLLGFSSPQLTIAITYENATIADKNQQKGIFNGIPLIVNLNFQKPMLLLQVISKAIKI
ncbi:hypothetical protein A9G29_07670 [Gilliamella sp. Fer2-1]|jgi:hypothetical protein|nr:hypothetical protein A9G29_07670 [Gilliamella apicola]